MAMPVSIWYRCAAGAGGSEAEGQLKQEAPTGA